MAIFCDKEIIEQRRDSEFIQAINEAYFGRTPGIQKVFNAFCDFREKYLSSSKINLNKVLNINVDHDKDLHRFVSEVERQFGYDSFSFIIQNDLTVNAYTLQIIFNDNVTTNPKYNVYLDKEGYHFKKDLKMSSILLMNTGLLFNNELSNEEAFSVVLHEIGHNFQKYLNGEMQNLASCNKILQLCVIIMNIFISLMQGNFTATGQSMSTLILADKNTNSYLSKAYNNITSDESKANIYSYFNMVRAIITLPKSILMSIVIVPLAPILGITQGISKLITNLYIPSIAAYGYLGEQMADAFPTYYGFAKSNIDIFKDKKLGSPFGPAVNTVSKIPIIGHLYNFALMPAELLLSISDEHPDDIVRCKAMINSMKEDIKDPRLSPKLRKELQKQIDDAEQSIDEYYKNAIKITNPKLFKDFIDRSVYYNDGGFKYKAHKSIFNLNAGTAKRSEKIRENYILNCELK